MQTTAEMDTSLTIDEGKSDNIVKRDVVKKKTKNTNEKKVPNVGRGRPRKYTTKTKQNESKNYLKLSHKPNTIKRIKQSQDLIKKGFNVCYALEEFIRL